MTWKYEPTLKETEKYHFYGPSYLSAAIDVEINREEIHDAIMKVMLASVEHNGLDRIQRLTHETTGIIIWIIDNISEEQKDEILEMSPTPENDLKESEGTTIMFPNDY